MKDDVTLPGDFEVITAQYRSASSCRATQDDLETCSVVGCLAYFEEYNNLQCRAGVVPTCTMQMCERCRREIRM